MPAKKFLSWLTALACAIFSGLAMATYHGFEIAQLYSNADGTVQFVVLHETLGLNGQDLLSGHTLTVTHAGRTKTFVFPNNLPNTNTANRYLLIATQGYADLATAIPEFAMARPDYVMPNQFLPTDGGTLAYADVDNLSFTSLPTDGRQALFTPAGMPSVVAPNEARNFAGAVVTLPALAVTAVEYYNPALDHYFISNLQPDIDALDSGRIAGWRRTGGTFFVFPTASATSNPVCRFYIPPQHGNSHFFSASPAECTTIFNRIGIDPNYSGYILETSEAFHVELPNTGTGACPAGTQAVYRLWNGRADSNHRYTTDLVVRGQMIGLGYIPEGYGPLGVAMCAPV